MSKKLSPIDKMATRNGSKFVNCIKCGGLFQLSTYSHPNGPLCATCPLTCTICGEEFPRTVARQAREHRCMKCNSIRNRKAQRKPQFRFSFAKHLGKRRGILFQLTKDDYIALIALPCHYCGFPLAPTGIGLDRVIDEYGYVITNVVPCCWECNCAKGKGIFTAEEMRIVGAAIGEVKRGRQERGETYRRTSGWGRPQKYADPA